MAAPPITERHLPHFHRRAPMKEAVRAATTANITISTALNNGDSLDGLTLATGERVLVKDQSTASQNGIYIVGATPVRDYDESTDDPSFGYLVFVREGTANGGTLWKNTNTSTPTVGSTSLTFAQFTSGGGLTDPMTTRGDIIVRNASNVTARLAVGAANRLVRSDGTDISWGQVVEADLNLTDVTTANATTGQHGFLKKLPGGTSTFLRGDGAFSAVPGSSGGGIQYPPLKPSPPTYDFDGSALDGAFSVHSAAGSFVAGDVMTQGVDWGGSAVELQLSNQRGSISVTHANADLEFEVGGIAIRGGGQASVMFGIAALNSSGTGVGIVVYNDNNAYLATITTYGYTAFSASTGFGHNYAEHASGNWWLNLKRISGTWTGRISMSGRAWDVTFATRADSITVAELHFGTFFDANPEYLRLTADYFHVAM